jgi:hypothetical protein
MTTVGARCAACVAGPQGIRGHAKLFAFANVGEHTVPIFKCEDCGTRYDRLYAGGGTFLWTRILEPTA